MITLLYVCYIKHVNKISGSSHSLAKYSCKISKACKPIDCKMLSCICNSYICYNNKQLKKNVICTESEMVTDVTCWTFDSS